MVKLIIRNCFQKSCVNRDFLKKARKSLKSLETYEIKQNIKKLFKKHFVSYLLVKRVFQRLLFQQSNIDLQENTAILGASYFILRKLLLK